MSKNKKTEVKRVSGLEKLDERWIIIMLLGMCVFAIALFPIKDSDAWWHLKTGAHIVDGQGIPRDSVYSFLDDMHEEAGEKPMPWIDHEWLTQIIMYGFYSGFGIKGLIFLKALFVAGIFIGLYLSIRTRGVLPWIAAAVCLLAAFASSRTIYLRPPLISYAFIVWFMLCVNLYRNDKRNMLFSLPLIMVIWVNMHGGAVIGLIIVFIPMAVDLITRWLKLDSVPWPKVKDQIGIFIACLIASLLNPYFYKVLLLPFEFMGEDFLVSQIWELQSPDFHFTHAYELMIILLFVSFFLIRKKWNWSELALIIFFLHQSLGAVRHLPVFALIAAPMLAEGLNEGWGRLLEKKSKWLNSGPAKYAPLIKIGVFFIICALIWVSHSRVHREFWRGPGFTDGAEMVEPVRFLKENKLPGRVFTPLNSSGLIIWELYPEYKVFMDSRFDIYRSGYFGLFKFIEGAGDDWGRYTAGLRARGVEIPSVIAPQKSRESWEDMVNRLGINTMIIGHGYPLYSIIQNNDNWRRVFTSPDIDLFVKNTPENKEIINKAAKAFVGGAGL